MIQQFIYIHCLYHYVIYVNFWVQPKSSCRHRQNFVSFLLTLSYGIWYYISCVTLPATWILSTDHTDRFWNCRSNSYENPTDPFFEISNKILWSILSKKVCCKFFARRIVFEIKISENGKNATSLFFTSSAQPHKTKKLKIPKTSDSRSLKVRSKKLKFCGSYEWFYT